LLRILELIERAGLLCWIPLRAKVREGQCGEFGA
jgi:hypothetical protein